MANRIKGITVEIGGDTTKLQTALQTMAQYYNYLGYSGIIFGSTVSEVGRNIVLFDKNIAKPCGTIEKYTVS